MKILILDDNSTDVAIIQRLLLKEKMDVVFDLAVNRDTFISSLDVFNPDVILSDHSMPQFSSTEALLIAREKFADIAFIMVTGTISEELAVNIIKAGADDYILKDRLSRLPVSINTTLTRKKAAIENVEAKIKNMQSESNLRAIFANTSEGFLLLDRYGIVKALNNKVVEYTLFSKGQAIRVGDLALDFIEDARKPFYKELFVSVLNGEHFLYERFFDKKGVNDKWIEFSVMPVKENEHITGICFTGRDITEKKNREREKEFDQNNISALINNTKDLMWSVDKHFNLLTSNNAFDEMITKVYGEPIKKGHCVLIEQLSEERLNYFKKCYELTLSGISLAEVINFGDTWAEVSFYPIYNSATIVGTACFYHDITDRKQKEEHLEAMKQEILRQKIQEQKNITQAIVKAQESERNHLGEELHDNINQLLAGTLLYLHSVAKTNVQLRELIQYPLELIDSSIQEIRLLCRKLVTPLTNINLEKLTKEMLENLETIDPLRTTFIYDMPQKLLADDLKLNIYRILQEQVNNILKHAAAKNVKISIVERHENISIRIEDDGKGFTISKKRKGIGISNMINRVKSYNGKIHIKSSLGNGCKIEISIPLAA